MLQVPRVHLKNLLKFQVIQVSEMNIQPDWNGVRYIVSILEQAREQVLISFKQY